MPFPPPRGPDQDPFKKRLAVIAQNARDLVSRDPIVSASATERLAELAPTAGELLQVVSDRDHYVRAGSARLLRRVTTEEDKVFVVEALRGVLHTSNDRVVIEVLATLASLRAAAALPDVRAFTDEPNPRVQQAVVSALGRLGGPQERELVARFVASTDQQVMLAAVQACVALQAVEGVPAILEQLEKCRGVLYRRNRSQFDVPRKLINALVALHADGAVATLSRFAQDEVGVRCYAVQALTHLKAAGAAPELVPMLDRLFEATTEEHLTCTLLHYFVAVDYRFALPELRRFLGHRLPQVRIASLKGLATWADLESVPAIRALTAQDPSVFVRPQAVVALSRLLGPTVLPDLAGLVRDSNPLVRESVARSLARMTPFPAAGVGLLRTLAEDGHATVARAARQALAQAEAEPVVLPVAPPGAVPQELQGQAAAARAFLGCWQARLGGENPELREALSVILRHLSTLTSVAA